LTTRYYAYISTAAPVQYRQLPDSIGVLEAPDQPMPIGIANCEGRNTAGLAVWRLTVRKVELPGRWIIVDREFRPVEG
jgi:hypothetical protein